MKKIIAVISLTILFTMPIYSQTYISIGPLANITSGNFSEGYKTGFGGSFDIIKLFKIKDSDISAGYRIGIYYSNHSPKTEKTVLKTQVLTTTITVDGSVHHFNLNGEFITLINLKKKPFKFYFPIGLNFKIINYPGTRASLDYTSFGRDTTITSKTTTWAYYGFSIGAGAIYNISKNIGISGEIGLDYSMIIGGNEPNLTFFPIKFSILF